MKLTTEDKQAFLTAFADTDDVKSYEILKKYTGRNPTLEENIKYSQQGLEWANELVAQGLEPALIDDNRRKRILNIINKVKDQLLRHFLSLQ